MNIDTQRMRNLTTGRLHTEMAHIYEDIEAITGEEGIMTHHLPAACEALRPYLRRFVEDERFWDGEYDTDHEGVVSIPVMDAESRSQFFDEFGVKIKEFWEKVSS